MENEVKEQPPSYPGQPDNSTYPNQNTQYTNHGAPPAAGYDAGYQTNNVNNMNMGMNNTVVYTNQPPQSTIIIQQVAPKPPNYLGLAIFTTLCCNVVFGVIAIIFSVLADSSYGSGDIEGARTKGKVSMGLSIAGIVLTVLGAGFAIVYVFVILPAAIFG